jgi:hypothetical protein
MTVDEPRVRVTTNLALGICLILLGTTLILDRLQLVPAGQLLRFWPVALVLFGLTLVIQSFQRPGVDAVEPRRETGLGGVIAIVIFSVFMWNGFEIGRSTLTDSNETANVVTLIGRHQRTISAPMFRGAEMTTIMGRTDLDLRQTMVEPTQETVIHVFTVMGGSTIRVPEGWQVDVRATPVMGGIKDRREGPRDVAGAPRIVIRGFIMWGGLDIRS